jgi:hypothetical protein
MLEGDTSPVNPGQIPVTVVVVPRVPNNPVQVPTAEMLLLVCKAKHADQPLRARLAIGN